MNEMQGDLSPHNCPCGREHVFSTQLVVEEGAITRLPALLSEKGIARVFLLADRTTYGVAGHRVEQILTGEGVGVVSYVLPDDTPEPDEANVGLAVMHLDPTVDAVVGVGSGVVNDIAKIVAHTASLPYWIVATAPSMDGYASATSSMTVRGLKISVPSKSPDAILGDLDILALAPMRMMLSGLGDMLAKYVSIAEWRIAHLITGEYYCEQVARLVRASLKKCTDNAVGLLSRDKEAVRAVFEGLVLCGAAMKLAGCSRPASGVEHYFSHVWDMRGASLGTPVDTHGIQCAVGTYLAVSLYDRLRRMTPDREHALCAVRAFDRDAWFATLTDFVGLGAQSMIALEEIEGKYDRSKHAARLDTILAHWQDILAIIDEELPTLAALDTLYGTVGMPRTMAEIGIDPSILPTTFRATRDIRYKYVLSHLCYDLGLTEAVLDS